MKKQFFLGVFSIMASASAVFAQNTAQTLSPAAIAAQEKAQQNTPSARTKEMLLKLQDALPFTEGQGAKAYPVFFDYFTAMQKAREDMKASGTMDREQMKATREKLMADRNSRLANILTPDQMKKFTEVIEPSMYPQRRTGGNEKQ